MDGSHVFISRALKDLTKLSSSGPLGPLQAQPKKVQKLKEMCVAVLEKINATATPPTNASMTAQPPVPAFPMEDAAMAFYAGCQCGQVEIVKVCLDTLQKMISYGHFSQIKSKDLIIKDGIAGCLIPNQEVQLQVVKALVVAVTNDVVHDEVLGCAVSCVFELCLTGKSFEVRSTSRTVVTQMVNTIYNRVETEFIQLKQLEKAKQSAEASTYEQSKYSDVLQSLQLHLVDAACNFIYFCSQADPDIIEATMPIETREVQMVLLSLDYVLKILKTSGPAFRDGESLLETVQESLLSCVVKGALNPRLEICKPCLDIVVVLISEFKQYLRVEIGTLFTTIIFRILESANIAHTHKISVLSAIEPLVSTGHILVDVFVNYDCDVDGVNLFQHLLETLSSVAQTSLVGQAMITSKEDYHIRFLAIQSIVAVLRSLVHWLTNNGRQCNALAETAPHAELLEKQRHWKRDVARAVDMFNKKPKKGVQFLMEADLIEKTPAGVARFIRMTKGLDMEIVGEYLSDLDPFNVEVMSEFTNSIEFRNTPLDTSLRLFLSLFKLPKEGQKIERVLEFFSTRWYEANKENPETSLGLTAPDSAYVVTVAIVMLNTDLHNPQVKNKMTMDQFCSQLRGANEGKDFPRPLLEEMYKRIESTPMILDARTAGGNSHTTGQQPSKTEPNILVPFTAIKKAADIFVSKQEKNMNMHNSEIQKIFSNTRDELKDAQKTKRPYYLAADVEHVKPMFGTTWNSILSAISSQLESATTKEVATLCLEAYDLGIHIAVVFEMDAEREAFIKSLAKLTHLDGSKPITTKSVLCIKQLLKTSLQDGDNLRGGWVQVFTTLSHIDRLNSVNPKTVSQEEAQNAERISKAYQDLEVHKIFSHAVVLSETGIRDFIVSLCDVALQEVGVDKPRMYCLQKVVEICAENVGQRIVPAWHQISSLMVKVGCHTDPTVAQYGVDSFRQLVSKLFEQQSLMDCQLQPEFLTPYKDILGSATASVAVHDFVIRCIHNIVLMRGTNLQKGWGVVLRTLAGVPGNADAGIVKTAFELLQHIVDNCLPLIQPYYIECIHTATLFASGTTVSSVSIEALQLLEVVLTHVDNDSTSSPKSRMAEVAFKLPQVIADTLTSDGDMTYFENVWNACLANYCLLMLDTRNELRSRACEMLTTMLQRCASHISPALWKCAYSYIGEYLVHCVSHYEASPLAAYEQSLCDFMQRGSGFGQNIFRFCPWKEWITTTAGTVFTMVRTVTVEHFELNDVASQFDVVISTITQIALKDEETVMQLALETLMAFVRTLTDKLENSHWRTLVEHVFKIMKRCRVRPTLLTPFAPEHSFDDIEVLDDPTQHTNNNTSMTDEPVTEGSGVYFMDETKLIAALRGTSMRQHLLLPILEYIIVNHAKDLTQDEIHQALHNMLGCAHAAVFFHHTGLHGFRQQLAAKGLDVVVKRMIGRLRYSYSAYFKACISLCRTDPKWKEAIDATWVSEFSNLVTSYVKKTTATSTVTAHGGDEGQFHRTPSMGNLRPAPAMSPADTSEVHAKAHVLVQVLYDVAHMEEPMFLEYADSLGFYELCVELIIAPGLEVRGCVQRFLRRHQNLRKGVSVKAVTPYQTTISPLPVEDVVDLDRVPNGGESVKPVEDDK
eukprot:PhF_6_TR36365/c0_g1_i1/m.53398/K18442/ARFGEF, BIG; brefeldin A-inhibited guanine nucleotide-exchange protein